MHFPNYREFYPKGLIPMNAFDKSAIENDTTTTHWLIALEGENESSKMYTWKIFAYRTDENGSFNHNFPQYISESFTCFHTAYSAANDLEVVCKTKGLLSKTNEEQIS